MASTLLLIFVFLGIVMLIAFADESGKHPRITKAINKFARFIISLDRRFSK